MAWWASFVFKTLTLTASWTCSCSTSYKTCISQLHCTLFIQCGEKQNASYSSIRGIKGFNWKRSHIPTQTNNENKFIYWNISLGVLRKEKKKVRDNFYVCIFMYTHISYHFFTSNWAFLASSKDISLPCFATACTSCWVCVYIVL